LIRAQGERSPVSPEVSDYWNEPTLKPLPAVKWRNNDMRTILLIAALLAIPSWAPAAPKPENEFRSWNVWYGPRMLEEVEIRLDINNVPVREALKHIFEQAKQEHIVDDDVPQDVRVTVRASNVKLSTALDLVTQAAGVQWTTERRDSRTVVRIGKSALRSAIRRLVPDVNTFLREIPGVRFDSGGSPLFFGRDQRSAFTCPHCKERVTIVGQKQQPKCPKCSRVFQDDWQFCPVDGSKRPPTPGAVRFCPLCGKEVPAEKSP
jgi:hypothetical protein